MIKVLDDAFGVEKGLMTTVHAYTNDQNLIDLATRTCAGPGRRPSTSCRPSTGAARATSLVLESMKGRLDGTALRVPVQDGSITDFTGILGREVDGGRDQRGVPRPPPPTARWPRSWSTTRTPIVSSDIVGSPASLHLRRHLLTIAARVTRSSRSSAGTTTSGATPTGCSTSSRSSGSA